MHKEYLILLFCIFALKTNAQKFGIIMDGGYSYRLYVVNSGFPDLESYEEKKKSGNNFSFEPVWYSEGGGIGIKYSQFFSSVSGDSMKVSDLERKSISEKIKFHYIGFQYHKFIDFALSDFSLNGQIGLGAIFYRNQKLEYKIEKSSISGRSYALNAGLNLEYKLTRPLIVFIGAGVLISNLGEVENNGYTEVLKPRESLTHIDFNLGFRFNIY